VEVEYRGATEIEATEIVGVDDVREATEIEDGGARRSRIEGRRR